MVQKERTQCALAKVVAVEARTNREYGTSNCTSPQKWSHHFSGTKKALFQQNNMLFRNTIVEGKLQTNSGGGRNFVNMRRMKKYPAKAGGNRSFTYFLMVEIPAAALCKHFFGNSS